jgi:hypothetical protein
VVGVQAEDEELLRAIRRAEGRKRFIVNPFFMRRSGNITGGKEVRYRRKKGVYNPV